MRSFLSLAQVGDSNPYFISCLFLILWKCLHDAPLCGLAKGLIVHASRFLVTSGSGKLSVRLTHCSPVCEKVKDKYWAVQ